MGPDRFRSGSGVDKETLYDWLKASMGPDRFRSGSRGTAGGSSASPPRFNGAGSLSIRKWVGDERRAHGGGASMGPDRFRSGSTGRPPRCSGRTPSFNGAGSLSIRKYGSPAQVFGKDTELQWGRIAFDPEVRCMMKFAMSSACCFNGAGSLSIRKWRCAVELRRDGRLLQWGRIAFDPEVPAPRRAGATARPCFNGAGSLSIRKWWRRVALAPVDRGFNGAGSLSIRKWPPRDRFCHKGWQASLREVRRLRGGRSSSTRSVAKEPFSAVRERSPGAPSPPDRSRLLEAAASHATRAYLRLLRPRSSRAA